MASIGQERTLRLSGVVRRGVRKVRLRSAIERVGRWCGSGLALALLLMLVDVSEALPGWMRMTGAIVVVGLVLIGIVLAARALVRIWPHEERVALLEGVEVAHGLPASVLRGAYELSRDRASGAIEAAMIDRACVRAESAVSGAEPIAFGVYGAWRWAIGVTALILGATFFAMMSPYAFTRAGWRLVDPLGDHPPVSPTRVECVMGAAEVLAGDGASVTVRCEGMMPASAWLMVWVKDEREAVRVGLAELGSGEGVWVGEVGPVTADLWVRAHTPTGFSRAVRVSPTMLARVMGMRAWVLAPEHARGRVPAREVSDPARVVEGSSVRLEFVTSIPALGMRHEDGGLVGEPTGNIVLLERAAPGVGEGARWVWAPVTALGDGPETRSLEVRTIADRAPTLRFVGDGIDGDVLRVRAGTRGVVGVEARDDLALDATGITLPSGEYHIANPEWLDQSAQRLVVVLDPAAQGAAAGDAFDVVALVHDTVPGRDPTRASLRVEVIDDESADRLALEALTIEGLSGRVEDVADRVAEALAGRASLEEALESLRALSDGEGLTDFERAAGEDGADIAERLRAGETERAGLASERLLRESGERLRLADALRRVAEDLARITDAQRVLAQESDGGEVLAPFAPVQRGLADGISSVVERFESLGAIAVTAPMNGEVLSAHRASIEAVRARVLDRAEALEGDGSSEVALRDGALTDLFFATDGLLERGVRPPELARRVQDALAMTERMLLLARAASAGGGIEEDLELLGERVRAIGMEAEAPLPNAGASALMLSSALRGMGVRAVMREAERAFEGEDVRGPVLAQEAWAMLDALRAEAEEQEAGGTGVDAPLSIMPSGAQESGSTSESASGSSSGGGVDALEQLSRNRERAREERAGERGAEQAVEPTEPGGVPSGGGAGEGGGLALGGESVEGVSESDGEGGETARPGRAGADARWVERESALLQAGGSERLARVPAEYRALVAAFLRSAEAARDAGGRIEE